MERKLQIRNSTAEFLIFEKQSHADSIEVRYEDGTLWLTQKMMAQLFDISVKTINEHLINIYKVSELEESSTIRKFRIVQIEGNRTINRKVVHYNLDAVISVGYRVNSIRATQFRRWATNILTQYAKTGYISKTECEAKENPLRANAQSGLYLYFVEGTSSSSQPRAVATFISVSSCGVDFLLSSRAITDCVRLEALAKSLCVIPLL